MKQSYQQYELDSDRQRIDLKRVCEWLKTTYWGRDFSSEIVWKSANGASLLVGAYRDGQQVGYLRVVSDQVRFAWVSDVFVDAAHRGQGLAQAMVRFAMDEPVHRDIGFWMLSTEDAERLYAKLGFQKLPMPERTFMYLRKAAKRENENNR
jgi:GNAT superfamily N-acetyltransferase